VYLVAILKRSADLGDAFAQARMAGSARLAGEAERFRWAEKSAAEGERDGFYELGHCYRHGIGCEKDVERAKENYLVAADFGHVYAMYHMGALLDKDDPQRFVWLGELLQMEVIPTS
jgi:TPR repeat protein